jgi:hypothetical protein
VEESARQILPIQNNHSPSPPPARLSSPTKVHWEEKVDNSNELMSHAVDPQVLFGTTASSHNNNNNEEDVVMNESDLESADSEKNTAMPPPIETAQSASHYSFESL